MTALILGLALFALLGAAGNKGPHTESKLPPEVKAAFNVVNGRLHYRAQLAELVLASMLSKVAFPTEVPNVTLVQPGDKPIMGVDEWGAYWVLMALHEANNDIWVPTNMHLELPAPQPVMFLSPGKNPPDEGFALLISAAQPWPQLPAGMPALA